MFDTYTLILILADAALYGVVALQLVRARRRPTQRADSLSAAFDVLKEAFSRRLPDLPPGYTWREAFEAAKTRAHRVDWAKAEGALSEYESYRYGGGEDKKVDYSEVMRLAKELRTS